METTKVENLSQNVISKVTEWNIRDIYVLYKNNELAFDRERLQRLLTPWHEKKSNEYLYTVFSGSNFKDCFQLANIKSIIEGLYSSKDDPEINSEFIEENLKYFKDLSDKGYKYLVLDGQHRIDTLVRFIDNKLEYDSRNPNRIKLRIGDETGTHTLKGRFDKLDGRIQDYLFRIPLLVVTYETGDLRELARIFITSNSMVEMSKHEKRILNYNETNRWLNKTCKDDLNINKMFRSIGKGMTGDYSLEKKGDTLFLAEMLMYIHNNEYEGYDEKILDNYLGSNPVTSPSKPTLELTKKIMKIMADGSVKYDPKLLKKFSKSSFYNLFITISFLLQKNNLWGKEKGIDGRYSIKNEGGFAKWFFDEEDARIRAIGTKISYTSANGKNKFSIHEWSYAKHNNDQKHKRKESVKGQGGSKYTFKDWARIRYLLEDLNNSIGDLEKRGIITKLGSRDTMSRDEALVALGVPLSQSLDIEINEIVPVSKGGNRELGNIEALPRIQNRVLSNRDQS